MRAALLALLAPALATAAPRLVTMVTGGEPAVVEAVTKVRKRLDACWPATAQAKLRLGVVNGAVKTVELVDGEITPALPCLTRALRSVRIAGASSGSYELQLRSVDPETLQGGMVTSANSDRSNEIDRVVKARAGKFRDCYTKELAAHPALSGKVIVRLKVAVDGKVTSASTASSTINNANVERCIHKVARTLVFPASPTPSIISYPFVFQQAG